MQQANRPVSTTYLRYSAPRVAALSLPATGRLESLGLFLLVCMFWGVILFIALTQAL